MTKYQRRLIVASVTIHIIAIFAFFIYWILTPDLEIESEPTVSAPNTQLLTGEENQPGGSKTESENPDKAKLKQDYKDGDLSDDKIRQLLSQDVSHLSEEEKNAKVDEQMNALSRTPVKHVADAANTALNAFGVKQEKSSAPMRPYTAELANEIDYDSMRLYDYEVVDGKYALIYKDKNNIYLRNDPVPLNQIDSLEQTQLGLIKKAKENKKFRILLDAAYSLGSELNKATEAPKE